MNNPFKKLTPSNANAERDLEASLASGVQAALTGKPKPLQERLAGQDDRIQLERDELDRMRKVELAQIRKVEAELNARQMRLAQIDRRIRAADAYLREVEARA